MDASFSAASFAAVRRATSARSADTCVLCHATHSASPVCSAIAKGAGWRCSAMDCPSAQAGPHAVAAPKRCKDLESGQCDSLRMSTTRGNYIAQLAEWHWQRAAQSLPPSARGAFSDHAIVQTRSNAIYVPAQSAQRLALWRRASTLWRHWNGTRPHGCPGCETPVLRNIQTYNACPPSGAGSQRPRGPARRHWRPPPHVPSCSAAAPPAPAHPPSAP